MSDINTMMQDMKTGFRRIENAQHKFEEGKRKNMDRYFQQVLNQKKQKYFEDLQVMQLETGGRSSTVDQMTSRVQTLKRHMIKNKDKIGQLDLRNFTGNNRQRNQIKFTKAGFPIHDYIKEMREEREKREFKKSQQQVQHIDPKELQQFAHLAQAQQPQRDILKALQEEMEQERKEREERLKYGGIESLQEDERLLYEVQRQMAQEQARQKQIIRRLIEEDMNGIDQKQFEQFKQDEMFMDEWTKQVIEVIFCDQQDSAVIPILKELLKLADKELYRQVRDKRITLRQFKTRCMEKLNGNQFAFIDYDDVVHLIHPECRNLDLRKIEKWSMAAYGKPFAKLPLKGEDSFINKLQDWQVQPHCLKSIANFSLNDKRRAESADPGSKKSIRKTSNQEKPQTALNTGFNFQMDDRRKKTQQRKRNDLQQQLSVSMDSTKHQSYSRTRQGSLISTGGPLKGEDAKAKGVDGQDTAKKSASAFKPSIRKNVKSSADEFYAEIKQFQINNGYLLRMIDDGLNVILTDELKARLYMTADDAGAAFEAQDDDPGAKDDPGKALLARKAADPTYGMTAAQKERYEKRMNAKPRPRDLFNVQELIRQRDEKIMNRRIRLREARLRAQEQKEELAAVAAQHYSLTSGKRDAASGIGSSATDESTLNYRSIPNQVFGGGLIQSSSKATRTGQSLSNERKGIGSDVKIKSATRQYNIKGPKEQEADENSQVETYPVVSQKPKNSVPSYENTPMSSAVIFQTQNLALKDKQDSHSGSGDVATAFRRGNISDMALSTAGVPLAEAEIKMEQIRLMERGRKGTDVNLTTDTAAPQHELKVKDASDQDAPKSNSRASSDGAAGKLDDVSSQYRDKHQKQESQLEEEGLPLKSCQSDAQGSAAGRKQVKKQRTVIDLLAQPENDSPSPRLVTDHDELRPKAGDASLVRFSRDRERNAEDPTPELKTHGTQPLVEENEAAERGEALRRAQNPTQQTDSSGPAPVQQISNVNILLMTPQNRTHITEMGGEDGSATRLNSDDGFGATEKHHPSLYRSNHSALSQTVTSGRRAGAGHTGPAQRAKHAPPPVIPLYQLDKYQVKPSVELKKKRQRQREALLEAQLQSSQAQRLGKRGAMSSAMTIQKTKRGVTHTFRGCMLKQTPILKGGGTAAAGPQHALGANLIYNNSTIGSQAGSHPYDSAHFSPPRGRNLLGNHARHNASSQELVRIQGSHSGERELSQGSRSNAVVGSQAAIEQPRVSTQFWQFLTDMRIPVHQSAVSHRNQTTCLVQPDRVLSSERDGQGATKRHGKLLVDQGSSIDGMHVNSQTRTGYQTSEQHVHEQSLSRACKPPALAASEENFEELSGHAFSSMPSPGYFAGDRLEEKCHERENFARLLNYTRQKGCAQKLLDYERQTKSHLKSQYARSPQHTLLDDSNRSALQPGKHPYQAEQSGEPAALDSFEHQLVAQQVPLQWRQKVHLSIESAATRTNQQQTQPPAAKKPLVAQAAIRIEEVGAVALEYRQSDSRQFQKINTDLLPSEEEDAGVGVPGHRASRKSVNYRNAAMNKSADRIGTLACEVFDACSSQLAQTVTELAPQRQTSSGGARQSNSVVLAKHTPHGRDANLMVNSENYTRAALQKQQQRYREEDSKALMALNKGHQRRASPGTRLRDLDPDASQSAQLELQGRGLAGASKPQRGGGACGSGGIREKSMEESSAAHTEDSKAGAARRKSDYVVRQNQRLRNVIRASFEQKKLSNIYKNN